MDKLIEFVGNNYAWFLTITIILLFALIGYIYDNRKTNLKIKEEDEVKDEEELANEVVIEEVKTEENPKEEVTNSIDNNDSIEQNIIDE